MTTRTSAISYAAPTSECVAAFLAKLDGVQDDRRGGWMARCPGHDDTKPSLSVNVGPGGSVLYRCFAGCSQDDVVNALGLNKRDLFPPRAESGNNGHAKRGLGRITETYAYTDADGNVLYEVVRFEPKDFRQRRPDGNGGWTWSLNGTKRVLYGLPALLASDPQEWKCIVEGERDADNLNHIGATATCNAGGAGKWHTLSDTSALENRRVAILPDNDAPGRKHAEQVAAALYGKAADIRIVELPDLPDKGDVSDWIDAGGTREALLDLIEAAPQWIPTESPKTEPATTTEASDGGLDLRMTDLGNARRLVREHGADLLFAKAIGWQHFDGTRWRDDDSGVVYRYAKDLPRIIAREAADERHDKTALSLLSFGTKCASRHVLENAITLASTEETIAVRADTFDVDDYVVNTPSATIDLRTQTARPHNRADRCRKITGASYDRSAKCPRFEQFIGEIFNGDADLIAFARRMCGYMLTGDRREQCLFLWHGHGANGKSVLERVMQYVLGDYATTADPTTFLVDTKNRGIRSDLARLDGVRFVASAEIEDGQRLAENLIKMASGEDNITARHLYHEEFTFKPRFVVALALNHLPIIRGQDYAIWRRIYLVPFTQTFDGDRADKGLFGKLQAESSGILNWMLRGFAEWQRDGLRPPEAVRLATAEYKRDSDALADFFADRCVFGPGEWCGRSDLRRAYDAYATENAIKYPVGARAFAERLRTAGCTDEKRASRGWRGVGLVHCEEGLL